MCVSVGAGVCFISGLATSRVNAKAARESAV